METQDNKNKELDLSKKIGLYNLIFGAIVILGGLIGYFTAKSVPSLMAGITFGNLLMLGFWGTGLKEETQTERKWGFYVGAIVSIILLIFFILRFIKTGKAMPAFIIIPMAAIGIFLNTYRLHLFSLPKKNI